MTNACPATAEVQFLRGRESGPNSFVFQKNDIAHLTKTYGCDIMARYRGVAQVVARQFRVLEAASSSPATSTKKAIGHPPNGFFVEVAT